MHPIEYVEGENLAAEVLTRIASDIAAPNELEAAASRLVSTSARAGFFRSLQKRLEQAYRAAA